MPEVPDNPQASISAHMVAALPSSMLVLLRRAAETAEALGWEAYLVGGYVRDALLGRDALDYDVDLAVVGDAQELARLLGEASGALLKTHGGFDTATLHFNGEAHLDFVTARRETYPAPGALPVVEASHVWDDLARRDFTVNAMAVRLLPGEVGPLLDPHGGAGDLQARMVRFLHPLSFRDDPTRIFRAVKLAARLGFSIERNTLEGILQAVRDGALYTLSMERISRELLFILEEPKADVMLAQLDKLGVLAALYPGFAWPYPPAHMGPTESSGLSKQERRDTYLSMLGAEYAGQPEEAETLARWLRLTAPHVRLMRDSARLAQCWPQLGAEDATPWTIYALLKPLDPAAPEAFARIGALSADPSAWERLHHYLKEWRHAKPELGGDFLRSLGVPAGPIYNRALEALLRAKLEGHANRREDEEKFLMEWLRQESFTPTDHRR